MSTFTNTRSHPRVDLFAQVQVTRDSEVYIMSAANISRGGIFVVGDPVEFPDLREGVVVELVIFASEEVGVEDARLAAKVIRVMPSDKPDLAAGFGLQFGDLSPEQARSLEKLLHAIQG